MSFNDAIPQPTDNISTSQPEILANFAFLGNTAGNNAEGYYKFPNGLIIQWGNINFQTSGTKTANFPIPFDTQCYNVTFSLSFPTSSDIVPVCIDQTTTPASLTLAKFRVNASVPSPDVCYLYWIAIGV